MTSQSTAWTGDGDPPYFSTCPGCDPQNENLHPDDFYYSHGAASQRDLKAAPGDGAGEGLATGSQPNHQRAEPVGP